MNKRERSAYSAEIGRRGGLSKSEEKAQASRENGRRPVKPGSRPRGRPRKEKGHGKA